MSEQNQATIAARAGINTDQHHGAVVAPIHLSSTYALKGFNEKREFDYSRTGNPTRATFAKVIAELEQGAAGIVTSTGMSAVHLLCQLLSVGDKVVIPHDCYGGSFRLFTHLAQKGQFELIVVDQTDQQALAQAIAQKPKLVLVETPSNPLLRLVDIAKVAELAHQQGALVAVDNTFLSPILQQPLTLGADIVFHSTTKYINGHSDVVGGVVVTKTQELADELAWWANCIGITGSAFDSFLATRGVKTLPIRINQHEQSAQQVAKFLRNHQAIANVNYPGFEDHPGYEIAVKQQKGFGAMLSFELNGGVEAVKALFSKLELFTLAQSLGGVESLISHPSTMTHAGMSIDDQLKAGISQSLVRISVGLEAVDDLIADLDQALNFSQQQAKPVVLETDINTTTDKKAGSAVAAQEFLISNPALAALW